MPENFSDLVVTSFFLIVMILISKFKKQLQDVDKSSYNYIASGIAILGFISLARVYNNLGLFNSLPFLTEPLFFQLINWIGIITGITFLISGVSNWVPLARNNRQDDDVKMRQLDFIKKIEQLVNFETRLDNILKSSLDYMLKSYNLAAGAVLKYSASSDVMQPVVTSGRGGYSFKELSHLTFSQTGWENYISGTRPENAVILTDMPNSKISPNIILPIRIGQQPVGFYLLWPGDNSLLEREEYLNLKIAIDIISRKIESDRGKLREEFLAGIEEFHTDLTQRVNPKHSIKENLTEIFRQLNHLLPVDFLTLGIVNDSQGKMRRLSVSHREAVLDEKRLGLPGPNTVIGRVMGAYSPVTVPELTETDYKSDKILQTFNIKSMAGTLLGDVKHAEGYILVGSIHPNKFRPRDKEILKSVRSILLEIVREEIRSEEIKLRERRIIQINSFMDYLRTEKNTDKMYRQAASLIFNELKTTIVLISTVSEDGLSLSSQVSKHQAGIIADDLFRNNTDLRAMPHHRLAIDSGRHVLYSPEEGEVRFDNLGEASEFDDNVKSALILPVFGKDGIAGTITLAERRNRKRFKYDHLDVLFVSSIAQLLSLSHKTEKSPFVEDAVMLTSGRDIMPEISPERVMRNDRDDEINRRIVAPRRQSESSRQIKSALTSIIASAEMLKTSNDSGNGSQCKYIDIVKRSSERLRDILLDEKVSVF